MVNTSRTPPPSFGNGLFPTHPAVGEASTTFELYVRTPCFDPVLPHGRVSLQAAAHDGDGAEVG
jgi:hypothetical protein